MTPKPTRRTLLSTLRLAPALAARAQAPEALKSPAVRARLLAKIDPE